MEAPRESWFSPKIEVRASRIHGGGTFALAVVGPGEVVEIWGEWWKGIKTLEYTNNPEKVEAARSDGKVVMQWDDELFSIEERGADDGYFINHSCDGNLWFRDAFTLEARKSIAQGEEITLDYALFERDDYVANWDCECGSAVCRKKGERPRLATAPPARVVSRPFLATSQQEDRPDRLTCCASASKKTVVAPGTCTTTCLSTPS